MSNFYVLRVLYTLSSKALYNGESMISGYLPLSFLPRALLCMGPMDQDCWGGLGVLGPSGLLAYFILKSEEVSVFTVLSAHWPSYLLTPWKGQGPGLTSHTRSKCEFPWGSGSLGMEQSSYFLLAFLVEGTCKLTKMIPKFDLLFNIIISVQLDIHFWIFFVCLFFPVFSCMPVSLALRTN